MAFASFPAFNAFCRKEHSPAEVQSGLAEILNSQEPARTAEFLERLMDSSNSARVSKIASFYLFGMV